MITREDKISQSIFDYAEDSLRSRGYGPELVQMMESFPYELGSHILERNIVAVGFDFDNPGEQAEMGSDLMTRLYTIQFWIFGRSNTLARNIANVIKFAVAREMTVPLKNIELDGDPVEDYLEVVGVSTERQIIGDPEPWQEFTWTTTAQLRDYYSAALA